MSHLPPQGWPFAASAGGRGSICFHCAVILLCLVPFASLVLGGLTHRLGANPVETITHSTGQWTLRLLLVTLSITPLRKLTGWHWLVQFRRTIALFAFFYACLHLSTYLLFEHSFDWEEIAQDTRKRPYVLIGFLSFAMLVPLAATSTHTMVKRLGGRNWKRLHRLAYLATAVGTLHYFWLVKRDVSGPGVYIVVLAALLCLRLQDATSKRSGRTLGAHSADGLLQQTDLSLPCNPSSFVQSAPEVPPPGTATKSRFAPNQPGIA
ncbi:MAG TPA: protein-methionine-sulfoxide reductase heme-binding subunit MsrQ [Methylococcus sp.]|nr:protein-methionine-sulfoxide reductase heme-binding subunit MsrQ [Methylococcus sp.]